METAPGKHAHGPEAGPEGVNTASAIGQQPGTAPLASTMADDPETLIALQNLEKRRQERKRKRRVKAIVAVAACALVGAGVVAAVALQGPADAEDDPADSIYYVQRQDFMTTVSGSGTLQPNDLQVVTPEVTGIIESVNAYEGQTVQEGDILLTIKNDDLDKAINDATTQVNNAQRTVDEAYDSLNRIEASQADALNAYEAARAQADIDEASAQAAYDQAYAEAMAEPEQKLQDALAEVEEAAQAKDLAQRDLEDAEAKLAAAKGTPGEAAAQAAVTNAQNALANAQNAFDIKQTAASAVQGAYDVATTTAETKAEQAKAAIPVTPVPDYNEATFTAEVEQARSAITTAEETLATANNALNDANKQAEKRIVRAPNSGTLISFTAVVGASVGGVGSASSSSSSLGQIGDTSKIKIPIEVNETDINQVANGQKATCTFPGVSDLEMEGRVTSVATKATGSGEGSTGGGVVTFSVEVTIEDPDPQLKSGMTANVVIRTQDFPDALVIPTSAITGEGDESYVSLVTDEETLATEPRTIAIATRSSSEAVVLSGLKVGDAILADASMGAAVSPDGADDAAEAAEVAEAAEGGEGA